MLATIRFLTLTTNSDRLINSLATSTSSSFANEISYNKKLKNNNREFVLMIIIAVEYEDKNYDASNVIY